MGTRCLREGYLQTIQKELAMDKQSSKHKKMANPATHFSRPQDILSDHDLSREEKKSALEIWEQDSRQLMTASNEGMPGKDEGLRKEDHSRLGEVQRAKARIGAKAAEKSRSQ
jgi:hypothetical protein